MERRKSAAVAVRVETAWSTKCARKVLINVGLNVTGEVRQYDTVITDILCTGRLRLLLLLLLLLMMMNMMLMMMLMIVVK